MSDTWEQIATERLRAAEFFESLHGDDWDAPSLCEQWSARDVLGHIVATAEIGTGGFLVGMARNGFRFNQMTASDVQKMRSVATDELIDRLRTASTSRRHPPGPIPAMLMEIVVHAEDVAYPLGRKIDHDDAALLGAADFAKNAQPLVGVRKRIEGLTMSATDADWSTGSGSTVSGPMVPLLLAMSGRQSAVDALSGDGVTTLRQRA
ncbi:MAG TPA: maleylpyruvate isomerase family mycothiol-dependent enzyme [Pseudonocardiaceae bacterium]|nr:maleylpyruvate isomerase family mycothiol-dependent enzyme [Pseudonocardiaceae bacterium]